METKPWYASKTVWAGVITVFIAVYNAFLNAALNSFGLHLPVIPDWVYPILGALGVYGRVTATTTVSK